MRAGLALVALALGTSGCFVSLGSLGALRGERPLREATLEGEGRGRAQGFAAQGQAQCFFGLVRMGLPPLQWIDGRARQRRSNVLRLGEPPGVEEVECNRRSSEVQHGS